jgi:hypothetical protein
MRVPNRKPPRCNLTTMEPSVAKRFQRWNIVITLVLALLVLGVFVAAEASTSLF